MPSLRDSILTSVKPLARPISIRSVAKLVGLGDPPISGRRLLDFFVSKPRPKEPHRPPKDNPGLGDPTGGGKDKPDPPKDPPPEEGPTKNPNNVPPTGCFIGDTPVLMADGLTKTIDAIAVGDQVMARDEKTGLVAAGAVARVFRHQVNETLLLQMEGGEVVETTAAHRFAAEGRGFVSACQLRPGDRLSTHNERGAGVVSTGGRSAEVAVYNLSVDRFHTFFVGGAGLWVHNVKNADPEKKTDPTP